MYAVINQVLDIGIALQKPKQLVDNTLQEDFFRGEQRKALAQVEAHLVAKDTLRARSGAVATHYALGIDTS